MPTILSYGQEEGHWYLLTEWIKSPSLRVLSDVRPGVIVDANLFILTVLESCLSTLVEIHALGFIHGEISPGNILADPGVKAPLVYLVDPAPQLDVADPSDTTRRIILGNPTFTAPEVLDGQPATHRADLYALGRVIGEAARLIHADAPDLVQWLAASPAQDRPSTAGEALSIFRSARANESRSTPGILGFSTAQGAIPQETRPQHWLALSTLYSVPVTQQAPLDWGVASRAMSVAMSVPKDGHLESASVPEWEMSKMKSSVHADFSVVAPHLIHAGRHFVVEVWVATSGEGAKMMEQATRGGRMVERGQRSHINLDRDMIITVLLKLPDFEVPDPIETLGWNGDIRNVGFIVKAPASLAPGLYPGSAKLMHGQIPFASIMFDLEVTSSESAIAGSAGLLDSRIHRIARAFASYASQDRAEVLRRVQGIRAVGINIFLDVVSLRCGQDWEREIYKEIDHSDSFFLFWSRNAAQSMWVDREWRYALKQRGLDFINPLPLEGPAFAEPPAALMTKHFNDMILALIKTEDAIRKAEVTRGNDDEVQAW